MLKDWPDSVQYFDRQTKEEHHAFGKVIVLAASCIDSTRILLNSKSSRFPNGIGNSAERHRQISLRTGALYVQSSAAALRKASQQ